MQKITGKTALTGIAPSKLVAVLHGQEYADSYNYNIRCQDCNQFGLRLINLTTTYSYLQCACCGVTEETDRFLMKKLNCDAESLLPKLVEVDLLPYADSLIISDFISQHIMQRKKIENFWSTLQTTAENRYHENPLSNHIGLNSCFNWKERIGPYVAFATYDELNELDLKLPVTITNRTKTNRLVTYPVFPKFSTKSRICGFDIAIYDHERKEFDTHFLPAYPKLAFEPGIFAIDTLNPVIIPKGSTLTVFDDTIDCFRLMARYHEQTGMRAKAISIDMRVGLPKPLLDVNHPLDLRIVLFSRQFNIPLFAAAATLDALLATENCPSIGRGKHNLSNSAHHWFDAAARNAFTLADAVKHPALPNDVACALHKLDGYYSQANKRPEQLEFQINVNGKTIVERNKKWSLLNGELISDFIVRIDRVFSIIGSKELIYSGVVESTKFSVEFTVGDKEFERNPFKFATRVVVDAGYDLPLYSEVWRKRAFEIITQFNKPKTQRIANRYGWCADTGIVFPNFILTKNGVQQNKIPHLVSPSVALYEDRLLQLKQPVPSINPYINETVISFLHVFLTDIQETARVGFCFPASQKALVLDRLRSFHWPVLNHWSRRMSLDELIKLANRCITPLIIQTPLERTERTKELLNCGGNLVVFCKDELQQSAAIVSKKWLQPDFTDFPANDLLMDILLYVVKNLGVNYDRTDLVKDRFKILHDYANLHKQVFYNDHASFKERVYLEKRLSTLVDKVASKQSMLKLEDAFYFGNTYTAGYSVSEGDLARCCKNLLLPDFYKNLSPTGFSRFGRLVWVPGNSTGSLK